MPFNSQQIKDLLVNELDVSDQQIVQYKDGKQVKQSDASRMVEMINTRYTPSIVGIEQLVGASQNQNKSIDFTKADSFIKENTLFRAGQILELCGNQATARSLKKFVQEYEDESFSVRAWMNKFGYNSICDAQSMGYKLIRENLMFCNVETQELKFHSGICRQAISQMNV